jgi:hypothetical protein
MQQLRPFLQHLQAAADHAVDGVVPSSAHTDHLNPGIATWDTTA